MKIKQTMRNLALGGVLMVSMFTLATLLPIEQTYAQTNNGCEVNTAIISCDNVDTSKPGVENSGLWSLLLTAITILTTGVGVLALAGVVYGAVLYTSAGGNPEQVKKAKNIFTNVVIGVIAFGGMFALLNFIVPGGVFN